MSTFRAIKCLLKAACLSSKCFLISDQTNSSRSLSFFQCWIKSLQNNVRWKCGKYWIINELVTSLYILVKKNIVKTDNQSIPILWVSIYGATWPNRATAQMMMMIMMTMGWGWWSLRWIWLYYTPRRSLSHWLSDAKSSDGILTLLRICF